VQGNQVIGRGRRWRSLGALGVLVCLAGGWGLAGPPARAAFPGRNGAISFTRPGCMECIGVGPTVGLVPNTRRVRTLIPSTDAVEPLDARFSPGGRLLAFHTASDQDLWIKAVSRRSRPRALRLRHPVGGDTVFDSEPEWSPDGKSLVFWRSITAPERRKFTLEIRIYHRGRSRLLFTGGRSPAWSVRDEIAFVRVFGDCARSCREVIYVVRSDGSGLRRIGVGDQPTWSPDGRRLAFTRVFRPRDGRGFGFKHIATVSRTGHGLRRVTKDSRCLDEAPVFSPGGGQLAFLRVGDTRPPGCPTAGLVVARASGRHLRRVASKIFDLRPGIDWQPLRRRR
jgi:Tol biopolymer transport system component